MKRISVKEHKLSEETIELDNNDIQYFNDKLNNLISLQPVAQGKFRIKATSMVGSTKLPESGLVISVTPKVGGTNFFKMLMYTEIIPQNLESVLTASSELSLLELLAKLFVKTVNDLLRYGIYRNYIRVSEQSSTVKGRLLLVQNIRLTNPGNVKPWCEYDEISSDVIENQTILFCTHLLSLYINDNETKQHLITIRSMMMNQGVTLRPIERYQLDSIMLQRLNENYEDSLKLCRFIVDSIWYLDFSERDTMPILGFFYNMNDLFEKFVTKIVEQELKGYDVLAQHKIPNLFKTVPGYDVEGKRVDALPMKPDMILKKSGKSKLVIDTKYKPEPDSSDFYQVVSYCQQQNCDGLILLPEIDRELSDQKTISDSQLRITIKSVSLTDSPEMIEKSKDEILSEIRSLL